MFEKINSPESRVVRILLIEDNAVDARLLELLLGEHGLHSAFQHDWVRAEHLSEGVSKLASQRFDVILLDLSLPDSQGLESLRSTLAAAGKTPVVILSGTEDDLLAIQAVREGAQDYLVKGKIDGAMLSRSLIFAIERKRALDNSSRNAPADAVRQRS
jgi:CheY-like chemotaxis protein